MVTPHRPAFGGRQAVQAGPSVSMAGDASTGPRRPSLPAHTPPEVCRPEPPPDRIVDRAVGGPLHRHRDRPGAALGTIKARMYTPAVAALREKGNPLG